MVSISFSFDRQALLKCVPISGGREAFPFLPVSCWRELLKLLDGQGLALTIDQFLFSNLAVLHTCKPFY